MERETEIWTVSELQQRFAQINFPEYQREPNVWSRDAKQRLVDSMLRQFDISSFYFYMHEDESMDCVDGRQRIGAIMSFLGKNPHGYDNGFEYKILNEIYEDEVQTFSPLDKAKFEAIKNQANSNKWATKFVKLFEDYKLTIVHLSNSQEAREFNLQFARLNLGTTINSGEKLHAMVGEFRDECFDGIGTHEFLKSTKVPTRRYSKEQLAAQILAQVFSLESPDEKFTRTRHFDIQRLFKDHTSLNDDQKKWIEKTKQLMNLLSLAFKELSPLKSRALVVSTVLLAYKMPIETEQEASELAEFINEFVCRLKWQVKKGLDVDDEYRYLIDFQRHVTQGSVEKPAVKARAMILKEEFSSWKKSGLIRGDKEYKKNNPTMDPEQECQQ